MYLSVYIYIYVHTCMYIWMSINGATPLDVTQPAADPDLQLRVLFEVALDAKEPAPYAQQSPEEIPYPRCSMVLACMVYLPTKLGHLWGFYVGKYTIHGASWICKSPASPLSEHVVRLKINEWQCQDMSGINYRPFSETQNMSG